MVKFSYINLLGCVRKLSGCGYNRESGEYLLTFTYTINSLILFTQLIILIILLHFPYFHCIIHNNSRMWFVKCACICICIVWKWKTLNYKQNKALLSSSSVKSAVLLSSENGFVLLLLADPFWPPLNGLIVYLIMTFNINKRSSHLSYQQAALHSH